MYIYTTSFFAFSDLVSVLICLLYFLRCACLIIVYRLILYSINDNIPSPITFVHFFGKSNVFYSTTNFVRNIFRYDKYVMIYNSTTAETCAGLRVTCSLVSSDFN